MIEPINYHTLQSNLYTNDAFEEFKPFKEENYKISKVGKLWIKKYLKIVHTNYTYMNEHFSRIEVRFMVFNTTFNNISVILWRRVVLVEETG